MNEDKSLEWKYIAAWATLVEDGIELNIQVKAEPTEHVEKLSEKKMQRKLKSLPYEIKHVSETV